MIKKFNEWFEYDDYEEENEQDDKFLFVGWIAPEGSHIPQGDNYKNHWNGDEDWIYIIQEEIDDENIIMYKNLPYNVSMMRGPSNNIKDYYDVLSKEDMEKYIYSNKKSITIYEQGHHVEIFYKDLPDEVKNNH